MHRASLLTLLALSLPVSASYAQQAGLAQSSSSSSTSTVALLDSPNTGGSAPAAGVSSGIVIPPSVHAGAFSGLSIGAKVGILGVGFEAATPLSRHLNLRGGANFFSFNDNFTNDGIPYNADLHFRSVEASVDYFPWAKSFHISPGALLYNGNQLTATAAIPAGSTFTLNGQNYSSSAVDPVTGNGGLTFSKAAPKLTVGWGNLIPRSGRHFSVPFEVGFAYVGDPTVTLNLAGTACYNYQGTNYCDNVATDPMIQSNLAAQRQKLANDADDARFFPIVSLGFAYSFGRHE